MTVELLPSPDLVARPLETLERSGKLGRPIRLMVVDAHPLVRWYLSQIAGERDDLVDVGQAATPSEAVGIAFAAKPDVATIECSTPDGDGWAAAALLRDRCPRMGIVILTSDDSDEMLFRAFNMGASAFLSKGAPIADVVAAIRHAAQAPGSFTAAGLGAALQRSRHAAMSAGARQGLYVASG